MEICSALRAIVDGTAFSRTLATIVRLSSI
jgi:hypothetical protein